MGDLDKEEFRVFFSDGVEQQVLLFYLRPLPSFRQSLSLTMISRRRPPSKVQKSLSTVSAGFASNDEVALVTYDEYPKTVADFSSDNDDLFTKLKRLELGSS